MVERQEFKYTYGRYLVITNRTSKVIMARSLNEAQQIAEVRGMKWVDIYAPGFGGSRSK
jgi:hypothetical protein